MGLAQLEPSVRPTLTPNLVAASLFSRGSLICFINVDVAPVVTHSTKQSSNFAMVEEEKPGLLQELILCVHACTSWRRYQQHEC